MASLVVRRLSGATKERLRRRAVRHRRSLKAEVRAILERAAQETAVLSAEAERFPDWFIGMTRPGIDLDKAIDENRNRKRTPDIFLADLTQRPAHGIGAAHRSTLEKFLTVPAPATESVGQEQPS